MFTELRVVLVTVLLTLPGVLSHAQELDGADTAAAARFMAADVTKFRRTCPGEAISVTVQPAPIGPGIVSRIVSLGAGSCFGEPGQNAYLLVKGTSGWMKLLSAEPGFIRVQGSRHEGYADLELSALGTCLFRYRWTGTDYTSAGSEACGSFSQPPKAGSLSRSLGNRH